MKLKNFLTFFILCVTYKSFVVNSYKILGLFTTPVQSHLQTYIAIINSLIDRGHNVTVVTTLPVKIPNKNYQSIYLHMPEHREKFLNLTKELQAKHSFFTMVNIFKFFIDHSATCLQHEDMKRLMIQEDSFDIVLLGYIFNEVQLGVASHFKSPVAVIWVNQLMPSINDLIGNPLEVSYVPSLFIGGLQPMSFSQRIKNYLLSITDIPRSWFLYYYSRSYYMSHFPKEHYPSYDEILRSVSLVLYNHHFSQNLISPLVPAAIEIGGIHVKEKPDALPEIIKQFLDSASSNGAIYFSLGTSVQSSYLDENIKSIYNVLSSLPQKILWKWDSEKFPGNSSNILFAKWFPQDDILAHSNVRLFITHGGLGSITEARYHAVPLVGIPFFGDQHGNLDTVKGAGWGRFIDFDTLNEDNFKEAIMDVLNNPVYIENVKRISKIYRDRPMSPRETAMYWIEYVIRHNGAHHMQSPVVHMNFISYYSLDVLALILGCLYIFYIFLKLFSIFLWRRLTLLWGTKPKKD